MQVLPLSVAAVTGPAVPGPMKPNDTASHDIGFALVVVDGLHEHAACFYLTYGFRRFRDHELELVLTTNDLRETFAECD